MQDLFRLLEDAPNKFNWPAADVLVSRDDPFLFVDDEDHQEFLMSKGHFRKVAGKTLEAALGGDTADVVDAIDGGEWDESLDFLHHAEREHENRSAVLEAITQRSGIIETTGEDGASIAAADLATTR